MVAIKDDIHTVIVKVNITVTQPSFTNFLIRFGIINCKKIRNRSSFVKKKLIGIKVLNKLIQSYRYKKKR